jgi:hypothetical protein
VESNGMLLTPTNTHINSNDVSPPDGELSEPSSSGYSDVSFSGNCFEGGLLILCFLVVANYHQSLQVLFEKT